MTEKEKAATGLLYNLNKDSSFWTDMERTSMLLFEYNRISPSEVETRQRLLKKMLKRMGESVVIRSPFFCDYGYNIEIGDNFFANVNFVVLDGAKVTIGNNVFVAPNVGLYTAGHPLDFELRNEGFEYARPIAIGNNVWIGAHVAVLPGVSIGDNVVIGAGSVVVKDIPANTLAVGNPCRVVKSLVEK